MLNKEAKLFQQNCEQVFSQVYYLFCFIYLKVKWTSFVFKPVFWEIYSKIKWMFGKSKLFYYFFKQKKEFRKKSIKINKEHQIKKKKKAILSAQTKPILQQWLESNMENPFPSHEIKHELAIQVNLTYKQVDKWFKNQRLRNIEKKEKFIYFKKY